MLTVYEISPSFLFSIFPLSDTLPFKSGISNLDFDETFIISFSSLEPFKSNDFVSEGF